MYLIYGIQKSGLSIVNYFENKNSPEALIWYGRRVAYLGYYKEAINIFTLGIKNFPNDARFYRHRGHRYISTRQYDNAIIDFKKAIELIDGAQDQIEPADPRPRSRKKRGLQEPLREASRHL